MKDTTRRLLLLSFSLCSVDSFCQNPHFLPTKLEDSAYSNKPFHSSGLNLYHEKPLSNHRGRFIFLVLTYWRTTCLTNSMKSFEKLYHAPALPPSSLNREAGQKLASNGCVDHLNMQSARRRSREEMQRRAP
ncbi:uncharacterized protein EV420DRAFT_808749 [Desarmillaria tabescens]|uniref:Secreted protein n=1 Tax=Armillaria tabescens TaxID=1929756 RepID=A0AA39NI48_ARMTA|nr:uncharacterized protein EV420DRAFT_808749 [Desarmillaria tabescens]KAK0466071.1 hypothetical protein EV420DRAFT_808749 [Desarmillaria tabescens]